MDVYICSRISGFPRLYWYLWILCARNHCYHHDMETEAATVCGTDESFPPILRVGIYSTACHGKWSNVMFLVLRGKRETYLFCHLL